MKRLKRLFAVVLALALVVPNFMGSMTVKADDFINAATAIDFVGKVDDVIGEPGKTVHVKLPVRAVGNYIQDPRIIVETENMPFTVSNITYKTDNNASPTSISTYETTYIEFDLAVKETAAISRNKLEVTVEFSALRDAGGNYQQGTKELKLPNLYFVINKEKEPAQLTVDNIKLDNGIKGNDTELSFVIKNEGEITSHNTYFTVEGYDAAGIIPRYSKMKQKVGSDGKLSAGSTQRVNLPITIGPDATAGNKVLTVTITYKDAEGKDQPDSSSKIYVNIEDNVLAPKVEVESNNFASELKAGDSFNLVTTLRNAGATEANSIEVFIEGGLDVTSFLPNFTSQSIFAGALKSTKKLDVKIPLIVSKEATGGIKKLDLKINYKDDGGVVYTTTTSVYIEVKAADGMTESGKPDIIITNVTQSPKVPNAGGRIEVSFDLVNKSNVDITDLAIRFSNLSNDNFSPINSDPFHYIDKLPGGKKARITIPLQVADTIPEGMSKLALEYSYKDAKGQEHKETGEEIYILDIENSSSASKPKLMISNFSTDVEELRAGNVFNFTFEIKNTHSHINAKNIKVTVSQAENIFSVTSGSNTIFINKIGPGEAVESTLELKVKSDTVTKAYPLEISIEYDYDGALPNPSTGQIEGETAKEIINLQAVENSRPVVDNVVVGNWDMPTVNQPTALTFEFYNMGKSPLNNVKATLEGDYYISTGSMYFIGNVQPGSSEFGELEVVPTMEGVAKGVLVITFEDSNGEEISVRKEFEGNIQGEYIPEFPDNGGGELFPELPQPKKPLLQVWLFVLIQVAIFVIVVPVTRKVVLVLYRRKLKKQEEAAE